MNLISPKKKKIIQVFYWLRVISTFLKIIILIFAIFIIPWFAIKKYIEYKKIFIESEVEKYNKIIQKINKENSKNISFKDIEGMFDSITSSISNNAAERLSEILKVFAQFANNIYITNIEYVTKNTNSTFKISGASKDRKSLIDLKNSLKKLDFVQSVQLPPNVLLTQESITYTITIMLK